MKSLTFILMKKSKKFIFLIYHIKIICAVPCLKLAFYCWNHKFRSILEGGNHSQLFLKPRITLFLLLLWAVLTLFLQFSIGKNTFRFIALVVVNAMGFFFAYCVHFTCKIDISSKFSCGINHDQHYKSKCVFSLC